MRRDGTVTRECPRAGCDWWLVATSSEAADEYAREHEQQHAPGRALDIGVSWEVHAACSVCRNGVGDVQEDEEGLVCQDCGTRWDLDGTGGETTK